MHLLLTTIGLGVAGIDPFAAIALLAAIVAGVSRKKVLVFFFSMFLFTVVIGTIGSLCGGALIENIAGIVPSDSSPLWIYVNLAVIVALACWLAFRWYRHVHPKPERTAKKPKRKLGGSAWQFGLAGIAYSFIGALSDVTFYGTVAVAAQTGTIAATIGLHALWFLIGQFALVALVIAYLFGAHKNLVTRSKAFWKKYKQFLPAVLYVSAGIVIGILAADIVLYVSTGNYLF